MKCIRRICKHGWMVAPGFRNVRVRVKHHVSTSSGSPADSLRIAPALVTDNDTKLEGPGLEHSPTLTSHVSYFLRRIDLLFVLPPRHSAVRVDYKGADQQTSRRHPFRPEHDRYPGAASGRCHRRPGIVEKSLIGRWQGSSGPPVAGHEALGKANDLRAAAAGFCDCGPREVHRLIRR